MFNLYNYPWLFQYLEDWYKSYKLHSLINSYLLVGKAGIGKFKLAQEQSKIILCDNSQNKLPYYCNKCLNCRLINSNKHLNLLIINRIEDTIKIEDARNINRFVERASYNGKNKVVIINNAEKLNSFASNSILKILEDSALNTIFMLISSKFDLILPTIRSRCSIINIKSPSKEQVNNWLTEQLKTKNINYQKFDTNIDIALNFSNYSPIKSINLIENEEIKQITTIIKYIIDITNSKVNPLISEIIQINQKQVDFIYWLITILISLKSGNNVIMNNELEYLASKTCLEDLFYCIDKLNELQKYNQAGYNLDKDCYIDFLIMKLFVR